MARKNSEERQLLIQANVLDFIKSILVWPSPEHHEMMTCAWDLLSHLTTGPNHYRIWSQLNEMLMQYLQQNIHNTCRTIVFQIYAVGQCAQKEGTKFLKILLSHFVQEGRSGPVYHYGLQMFLQYFATREERIGLMYQQLRDAEKKTFMQFIVDFVDYSSKPTVNIVMSSDDPVSSQLLQCICNDFIAKNAIISLSALPKILELFEVIAHASSLDRHEMDQFDFPLLLNTVNLFQYVRSNDEAAEKSFVNIQRNSKDPLKEIILKTITNLTRGNERHKRRVSASIGENISKSNLAHNKFFVFSGQTNGYN